MIDDRIQDNKLQLLGKLTASLIHEIRNPLSAIKLNLDYLKMLESELPPDANGSINDSAEAVERIQFLIESLLNFSRKKSSEIMVADVNEITKNAVSILKGELQKKNVNLALNLCREIPPVVFDSNKLLQVFLNLITNAMEACCEKGSITINSRFDDSNKFNIIWEVIDNGAGINEENKKKIFQEFYTSKVHGTGLGLSVCKMLIEEYNAGINFESEFGNGTKFIISFDSIIPGRLNER
jgi:signal transduction histidine kinase